MARIRSIHPGLWTDEAFMSLTAHARLLLIGIWTEAFDDGVFDWKPLTLKARIFPVDSVDVSALLDELRAAGIVDRDEGHEKKPGLIRNFQKFQRPKKPNNSGMLREEWRTYVGCSQSSTESVPNQSSTSTEKPPQMEDGGDKGKREANASLKRERDEQFDAWYALYPRKVAKQDARKCFDKALTLTDLVTLMASVRRFASERAGEDQIYTMHPDKWLRGEHWNDEPAPKRAAHSPPPKPLTQGESLRNMARQRGIIDATGAPTGRVEPGHRDGENPSSGDAFRLAITGDFSGRIG